jgi:hypothetical protein
MLQFRNTISAVLFLCKQRQIPCEIFIHFLEHEFRLHNI